MRDDAALLDNRLQVTMIGNGSPAAAGAFRTELQLPFAVWVDPTLAVHAAFGLRRMRWRDLFRPALWRAYRSARRAGFRQTGRGPHAMQLGGSFVIQGDRVVAARRDDTAGQLVRGSDLLAALGP